MRLVAELGFDALERDRLAVLGERLAGGLEVGGVFEAL